jgi:hypothetical protein
MNNSFLRKHFKLLLLIVLALLTLLINQSPLFIEKYYATGIYPYISCAERWLLGWIPFSIGDILYGIALIWIISKLVKFIKRLQKKQLTKPILLNYGKKLLQVCLIVYVSFNWLWGFNYNRLGSAYQMQLKFDRYSNEELVRLTDTLLNRMEPYVNDSAAFIPLQKGKVLTGECVKSYAIAKQQFPFLNYQNASVKPHMLYTVGNYIGFLGYLNPFTAEAQMNTTIPLILKPSVLCHEMGHQLGYASESEANFIGFIACKQSHSPAFRYSIYYDMFGYAISDLYYRDSSVARQMLENLPEKVKRDRLAVRLFFRRYKNPVSPLIDWFYDKYLKLNSQPKGRESYNEVVGWMIAYAKRYGWEKL